MANAKFGTDGIRGKAGEGALTPDVLTAIAASAGRYMRQNANATHCVIGRDTRESGHSIEAGDDVAPGSVFTSDDAAQAYVAALTGGFRSADLSSLKIVLDCANGAAFETAPAAMRALGATHGQCSL